VSPSPLAAAGVFPGEEQEEEKDFFRDSFSLVTAEWPAADSSKPVEVDFRNPLRPPGEGAGPGSSTTGRKLVPPLADRFTDPQHLSGGQSEAGTAAGRPAASPRRRLDFGEAVREISRVFYLPGAAQSRLPQSGGPAILFGLFVPFLICGGIWLQSKSGSGLLMELGSAGLPRLPPAGLEIIDVHPDYVLLDSGKKVVEVRGRLINLSAESYRDIVVEAGVFDRKNKRIFSQRVPLRNSLRETTRIASLAPESIDQLQQDARPEPAPVKPDSDESVRFVLPAVDGASWIGARVYSVRRG
jgi:hypothetical protein